MRIWDFVLWNFSISDFGSSVYHTQYSIVPAFHYSIDYSIANITLWGENKAWSFGPGLLNFEEV
jgi:hypothetical protein